VHSSRVAFALGSTAFAGVMLAMPSVAVGQRGGNAPVAPSSVIGAATSEPTFSVLGLASSRDGGGAPLNRYNDVWLGATQPLGRIGAVRFAAIGNGNVRARDGVASNSAAEGTLALRARARVGGTQLWSAVSYGYVNVKGGLAGQTAPGFVGGLDGTRVDTSVARLVDIGSISRAEAGMISEFAGVEFSFGMAFDRASRVTTQTVTFTEPEGAIPSPMPIGGLTSTTRTTRSLQRRDIATGVASAGFTTGPTTWLVSLTSPVASWVTSDALSSRPRISPTIASIAAVQPLTAWLSVVGAAATNSSSVGNTALRDDLGTGRNNSFAPVVALGVRIARLPFFGHSDDTPSGILSFETRMIGLVDSATLESSANTGILRTDVQSGDVAERDTLRIVLLIDAPKAESVELMGDATQWLVSQMTRARNGLWRAELRLAPGVHRISVRANGGRWIAPPNLPLGNDDYGSPVGMIIVRGKN